MDAALTEANLPATEVGTGRHLALVAGQDEASVAASLAALTEAGTDQGDLVRVYAPAAGSRGYRGAVVADPVPRTVGRTTATTTPRELAMLFPGLGDHHADMAAGLYRDFGEFAAVVDHCAEVLIPELGLDIRDLLCTGDTGATGELDLRALLGRAERQAPSALDRTEVAQPALFTIEYALATLWRRWGARPSVLLGYSLGEYVAACLAGVLTLDESLLLVARRAKLIETLPEGAMLAVTLPEADLAPLLTGDLALSAVNGPDFCVAAGPVDQVTALRERLTADGVVARPIRSRHAFHTPMMAPIAERVTEIVRGLTLRPPRIPYFSNVTGALVTEAEALDPGYWARHLTHPVRFAEGLRGVADARVLLETGPGQTLSSMATALRGGDSSRVVASMRHSLDGQDDTTVLLRALGHLWNADADLDWSSLPSSPPPRAAAAAGQPVTASELESEIEAGLRELWARLLSTDDIPTDVSFFDIGGNSLSASRLALRIQRKFGVELRLRQLYTSPSIAAQAALIEGRDAPADAVRATTGRNLLTLPNGLVVSQQNEAETKHFYHDIFDNRGYASNGITIPDGATVVDAGGNIGLFTLFAHTEASDVRIYTFEPAPPMFEHLKHNVERHGVNATLFNAGLSDHEGTAEFTFYPRSSGMSSFHADEDEERRNLEAIVGNQSTGVTGDRQNLTELLDARLDKVEFTATLRTLSAVIREQGITTIDLIKIDVQKAELAVIGGIDDEHWPLIRQIVLEVHDGTDGRVAQLTKLLEDKGFRVLAVQDDLYRGTDINNLYAIRD